MDPKMGGVSQAILNIIKGLDDLKVQNEVLSLDAPGLLSISDELTFHAKGPGKTPWQFNNELSVWLADNLLLFDAIIVHGLWLYYGYAALKQWQLKKAAGKVPRLYVMPHGMLDPYFQKAENRKLKAIRNIIYWQLVEKKLINQADGILFTCEEEKNLAQHTFKGYLPIKEFIVGLGVDPPPVNNLQMKEAFLATCPGVKDNPYFLFLSRIHPKKGVDNLINAYAALAKQIQGKQSKLPKLVIAGPGLATPFGIAMQQLAESSGQLNKTIFFCGMLTGDAKWGAFYNSNAFILPSHQENFGIAVVEALSCAKPVLISNQINIWREIEKGGAGIIADDTLEGTGGLLINYLQTDLKKNEEMPRNAASVFAGSFSIKAATQKLYSVLKS